MDFGQALELVKNGGRVTRAAWADGTFLYLVPGSTFTVNRAPLLGIYPEGTEIRYRPHIDIRGTDGTCSPWQPAQDALLAGDWETVPPGATGRFAGAGPVLQGGEEVNVQVQVHGNTVMSDDDAARLAEKIGRRLRGGGGPGTLA